MGLCEALFNLFGLSAIVCSLWQICKKACENLWKFYKTTVNEDWRGANNNVNVLSTDWFILKADFWLYETLSHVRESRFAIGIGWRNFRMAFSCGRFHPKILVSMKKKNNLHMFHLISLFSRPRRTHPPRPERFHSPCQPCHEWQYPA